MENIPLKWEKRGWSVKNGEKINKRLKKKKKKGGGLIMRKI